MRPSFLPACHLTLLFFILTGAYAYNPESSLSEKEEFIAFKGGEGLTPEDRVILENFVRHAVEYAKALDREKVAAQCRNSPEMFAWVEFRHLNCLNIAYELTGDPAYLDLLRDRIDLFRSVLSTGPDPYLGWYGSPIPPRVPKDNPEVQIDELQMNFRAIALMGRWVELARMDAAYEQAHRGTIAAYLALMEDHLFPKWDHRGHFKDLGARGGVYRGLDYPLKGQVTLSHVKLSIMLDGCLQLFRITGKDMYLRRALKIGMWFKSNLSLKNGHYEWMSWCPAGEWDVSPDHEDRWKVGWMAPDPNAAWYVTSLSIALNLYQHGLLFDRTDLQRFITTQKAMCWNGNMENPEYRNVAGEKNEHVRGRYLSYQLAHYDSILTKLAFHGPHEPEQLQKASNPWQGGPAAQEYVCEKYLMHPVILDNPQPYRELGQTFLSDPENRTWYENHSFEVVAPGAVTPRQPSGMFP